MMLSLNWLDLMQTLMFGILDDFWRGVCNQFGQRARKNLRLCIAASLIYCPISDQFQKSNLQKVYALFFTPEDSDDHHNLESPFPIGTLSHLVGSMQPGFNHLPSWSSTVQCADERMVVVEEQEYRAPAKSHNQTYQQSHSFVKPIKTKRSTAPVNLDDFYGDSTTSSSNFDESERMNPDKLWALDSEDDSSSLSSYSQ